MEGGKADNHETSEKGLFLFGRRARYGYSKKGYGCPPQAQAHGYPPQAQAQAPYGYSSTVGHPPPGYPSSAGHLPPGYPSFGGEPPPGYTFSGGHPPPGYPSSGIHPPPGYPSSGSPPPPRYSSIGRYQPTISPIGYPPAGDYSSGYGSSTSAAAAYGANQLMNGGEAHHRGHGFGGYNGRGGSHGHGCGSSDGYIHNGKFKQGKFNNGYGRSDGGKFNTWK